MTERQFNEISVWQKQTFGHATPLSKIAHLSEELQELVADLQTGKATRRLEFADCFFLLFGAAAADGMTYQDICNAIQEKFEINKLRKWGKPDANGVVNHIKSEPAETGGAEEVWNIAVSIFDKCRCEPIYTDRKMVDPNCAWCEYHVDFIQAMTTYAAQRCAEKDRKIIEWKQKYLTEQRFRIEDAASSIEDHGFQCDRIKQLQSELSEANKRIESIDSHRSYLIESVKKWGGAWRKCRAELKEARKEIKELKEQISYLNIR